MTQKELELIEELIELKIRVLVSALEPRPVWELSNDIESVRKQLLAPTN